MGHPPPNCTGTEWNFNHFTDDMHDGESNLEHTWFRQLSGTQGRWMSPDPYIGSMDFGNPQTMNRYAYVLSNPLSWTDPFGLEHGNDCGGPCHPFVYVNELGCNESYDFMQVTGKDGKAYDVPFLTGISCPQTGGIQASVSNATSLSQLGGPGPSSVDFGGGAADGLGGGVDVSFGSATQLTVTVGGGLGGWGGAAVFQQSLVVPFCQ